MTELNNAIILITGAAGGFGQELTRQLLELNARLILTDVDEETLHDRTVAIQKAVHRGAILARWAIDLSTRAGCELLYSQVKGLGVSIDILINNAGIGLLGRMDEVPLEKWHTLMQVNLLAPMHLCALFSTDMIQRQQGHIVNISSLAGWVASAGMAHYSASKFGLRGFSEGLRHELQPFNIRVTVVYPFFSRTPILQAERYGSLVNSSARVPPYLITDPAKIMAATIHGIGYNKREVFPDLPAKFVSTIKRLFPSIY